MKRNDWGFEYTAKVLAEAAHSKRTFHQERFAWWKDKKDQVLNEIRSNGIEVDEKIALEYRSPKSRDWDRGTQVAVREDLSKNISECMEKLSFHASLINDYDGWHQVLVANDSALLSLDHSDWLFFFGQQH